MAVTPNEMVQDIENQVRLYRENKDTFQTGLKDLGFYIDEQNLTNMGLPIPSQNINQAELANLNAIQFFRAKQPPPILGVIAGYHGRRLNGNLVDD